jgi:hypothetical protein
MRHFIFTVKGKGKTRDPFYVDVFEIKGDFSITSIGHRDYSPSSTRGEISEAYEVLYEKGIVSEEEYRHSNGYYCSSKALVRITEI